MKDRERATESYGDNVCGKKVNEKSREMLQ